MLYTYIIIIKISCFVQVTLSYAYKYDTCNIKRPPCGFWFNSIGVFIVSSISIHWFEFFNMEVIGSAPMDLETG